MSGFWKREDGLERRLRNSRPEPREDFVRALTDRVSGTPQRRSRPLRVGLADAVTAIFVISLSAFGGIGYAAAACGHAVHSAVSVVSFSHNDSHPGKNDGGHGSNSGNDNHGSNQGNDGHGNKGDDDPSSGDGEYGHKVAVCHNGHTIRVDRHAVPALIAHGDTLGQCP